MLSKKFDYNKRQMWHTAKIINRIEPHYTTWSVRYKWWEKLLKAKVEASGMKQDLLDLINQEPLGARPELPGARPCVQQRTCNPTGGNPVK